MLKIGTSKMGSVVDSPRCHKPVVVPPQSVPEAEQLYQILKNKRAQEPAPPPGKVHTIAEPNAPESAWDELGGNVNEADLNQWIDDLWKAKPSGTQDSSSGIFPAPSIPDSTPCGEAALSAFQKRHQLLLTLIYVSAAVSFFAGIVFGIGIYAFFIPSTAHRQQAGGGAGESGITGTLYYFNEFGERRADVDAVIICLPKESAGERLLSCRGLRPGDAADNDAVQRIQERGGVYQKADAYGAFTLHYRAEVQYIVIFISANQIRSGGTVKPSDLHELRQYFSDPDLFGENCLAIRHLGGRDVLEHTFEFVE